MKKYLLTGLLNGGINLLLTAAILLIPRGPVIIIGQPSLSQIRNTLILIFMIVVTILMLVHTIRSQKYLSTKSHIIGTILSLLIAYLIPSIGGGIIWGMTAW